MGAVHEQRQITVLDADDADAEMQSVEQHNECDDMVNVDVSKEKEKEAQVENAHGGGCYVEATESIEDSEQQRNVVAVGEMTVDDNVHAEENDEVEESADEIDA